MIGNFNILCFWTDSNRLLIEIDATRWGRPENGWESGREEIWRICCLHIPRFCVVLEHILFLFLKAWFWETCTSQIGSIQTE